MMLMLIYISQFFFFLTRDTKINFLEYKNLFRFLLKLCYKLVEISFIKIILFINLNIK